jgi:hypothetical protein
MTPERRVAPQRATSATLTGGTVLGAACFAIALAADLAGLGGGAGASDVTGYAASLAALDPTAWAVLGSAVIIVTPAVGLVVTALEYESIGDRRAVLMALAVLAILATSLAVAVLT